MVSVAKSEEAGYPSFFATRPRILDPRPPDLERQAPAAFARAVSAREPLDAAPHRRRRWRRGRERRGLIAAGVIEVVVVDLIEAVIKVVERRGENNGSPKGDFEVVLGVLRARVDHGVVRAGVLTRGGGGGLDGVLGARVDHGVVRASVLTRGGGGGVDGVLGARVDHGVVRAGALARGGGGGDELAEGGGILTVTV